MNEEATITSAAADPRLAAHQLELNRQAVGAADDAHLRELVHPSRWERRGVLGTLRRRSRLSSVR